MSVVDTKRLQKEVEKGERKLTEMKQRQKARVVRDVWRKARISEELVRSFCENRRLAENSTPNT